MTTLSLARRAAGFVPSPVRDVWEVSMQPGMISLAGGNPDLSLMGLSWMASVSAETIQNQPGRALQYGSGTGDSQLRAAITELMAAESINADPESIQVTSGSQMGLDLIVKLLCDPGDIVLAEGPTYVGALGVFGGAGVQTRHVAMDAQGLIPEDLERVLGELAAVGTAPKFLYSIPNFHNPTGITLATERRERVVRICARFNIPIIEDNPYGLLNFDDHTRPALVSFDPERVIYLGSFSKILAPGLRVGWVSAPHWLRRPLQLAAESTTICPSSLSQELASQFIATRPWRKDIAAATAAYRRRANALCRELSTMLPQNVNFTLPVGGFFSWVTLPQDWDTAELLEHAIARQVVFVQGSSFYADGQGTNQLRLAFSAVAEEQLAEGARRLANAMNDYAASRVTAPATLTVDD
ncbi:PLP-dependent aminotransferase family protein [Glutamicibacter sp. PS]|uniref:aminotransferase-like domain-containing protein n=1 Tax=Glutamicibacter sp. PS TaxID=3075634 RepID=UPI002851A047|nr:PLP-dependent aminotransferase family protein [Glutamicibacter sp. PS]MDR4534442.1 PLP-dependent aminotransferase family protein [Glutamicibacter sp. PS]